MVAISWQIVMAGRAKSDLSSKCWSAAKDNERHLDVMVAKILGWIRGVRRYDDVRKGRKAEICNSALRDFDNMAM